MSAWRLCLLTGREQTALLVYERRLLEQAPGPYRAHVELTSAIRLLDPLCDFSGAGGRGQDVGGVEDLNAHSAGQVVAVHIDGSRYSPNSGERSIRVVQEKPECGCVLPPADPLPFAEAGTAS